MRKFEVEVAINPSSVDQAVRIARKAELLGAEQIGLWDSPALYLDPWVALGVLSREIRSVPIGVCVTNPVTRHVVVTANAIASLSQAAEGGVYLGVGTGDSGVYNLNGCASTIADLKAFVIAVRELLESGRTEIDGKTYRISVRPRGRIPIYLAAHGRRSLELGAELGDGLILGLGHSADVVEPVMNVIADVRARVGGRVEDLLLTWNSGGMYVDDVPGVAVDQAEWLLGSFAHHFSRFGMKGKFVPEKYQRGIFELGRAYDLRNHGSSTAEQVRDYRRLASDLGVRDYLMDRFVIAGTPAEVSSRIDELAGRGVRRFNSSAKDVDEVASVLELSRGVRV
ncbi:LLM class flavin-dependent oxidoreductase [Lentzea sp. JNUCC 0626]|uniref:LLM class flavin-dependent oxidoreductase n=1 Tax=Lentzea sp. JNUCC 0626 TaxID=3367513 RepID=UPI00374A1784